MVSLPIKYASCLSSDVFTQVFPFVFQETGHRSKMIDLLQEYVEHVQLLDDSVKGPKSPEPLSYRMPYNFVSPDEWSEFENVYHVHCPTISVDNAIRDVRLRIISRYFGLILTDSG
jgi:hypothetical protein